jgi:hypothetical protein
MSYGPEHYNVSLEIGGVRPLVAGLGDNDVETGRDNGTKLYQICALLSGQKGYLYFPPGVWVIGRPRMRPPVPANRIDVYGEADVDILIPDNITLMMAPGAVLVPVGYSPEQVRADSSLRREVLNWPESEKRKVRIEFQGTLAAPIMKIFEALMPSNSTVEAGRIIFVRDRLRTVYPEWWGAVPLVDEQPPSDDATRRTTAALQYAFDAAFNHRGTRTSIPVTLINDYAIDRPLRVGMTLSEVFGPPIPLPPPAPQPRPEQLPEFLGNSAGLVIHGECGPSTRSFGAAMIKAGPRFRVEDSPRVLADGSRIREPSSLMVIRVGVGVTVENVVFDANEFADRCVTLHSVARGPSDYGQAHQQGFEGCEFRNARVELVHVGGELPQAVVDPIDSRARVNVVNRVYFSDGQDFSSLQFTRCRFNTGTREAAVAALMQDNQAFSNPLFTKQPAGRLRWRIGLVLRTTPGLGMQIQGCTFVGPASPMILGLGGRLTIQDCAFRTDIIPPVGGRDLVLSPTNIGTILPGDDARRRLWNGTDIYIAAPFTEVLPPDPVTGMPRRQTGQPTTFTARRIESRSRQFLSTYASDSVGALFPGTPLGASTVLLIQVRHRDSFGDDPFRPAIYWGGIRQNNNVLTLVSCLFGRGTGPQGAVFMPNASGGPVVNVSSRRVGNTELLHTSESLILTTTMQLGARM